MSEQANRLRHISEITIDCLTTLHTRHQRAKKMVVREDTDAWYILSNPETKSMDLTRKLNSTATSFAIISFNQKVMSIEVYDAKTSKRVYGHHLIQLFKKKVESLL